jgi:hypothetical protein
MKQGSRIGFDIDGVITSSPEYFVRLAKQCRDNGGQVHIVSSRSDRIEVINSTRAELAGYGMFYDQLCLLPSIEIAQVRCPEESLDWYQKYLWQKVSYCLENRIDRFYDDDLKVVDLFRSLAKHIAIYHVVQGKICGQDSQE